MGRTEASLRYPRVSVRAQAPLSLTRTSSSLEQASSPGIPALCSLCSKAASSPIGLCWAGTSSCSYSTYRLLSGSLLAGDPVGTWYGSKVHWEQGCWLCPAWPHTWPHTPVVLCFRLGTCTSRLVAFLVLRREVGKVVTLTAASPLCTPGATARGGGAGICRMISETASMVPPRKDPIPSWVGRGHNKLGYLGAHSFLGNTEELGHISDDRAKVVIHFEVRAHPGGQLGSGISIGEPEDCVAISLRVLCQKV